MVTNRKYQTGLLRVLAAFIDGLVFLPVSLADLHFNEQEYLPEWAYLVWFFFSAQAFWVYSVTCHAYWGQTIGKRCVGVKLVRNDDESPIGWKQAFLRDSPYIVLVALSMVVAGYYWILFFTGRYTDAHWEEYQMVDDALVKIIYFWALIEFVTMLTNSKRRAVHDWIAGTVVIRKSRR